ncbi:hypothetical protein [Alkalimarinus sediminis]|uniref:Uncharacterized protein n=1 Tax=Alkalimarinus sediminis TaxID=1632866 RepID=A0A9E8HK65_9ALTE|nr:hypothetical protein [Alkalimarinus sediminis]UZW76168.1 hypothetical protein NNL22_06210 [Alkalimarinus sediminis]
MRTIKVPLILCILLVSINAQAILIDFSIEGTVSNLGGTSEIIGLSEGDLVFASWTMDTDLINAQRIITTLPSTESGSPTVASMSMEGGISSFSLHKLNSVIVSNSNSSSSAIFIGENGAPPTDTISYHDSGIFIGGLSNNGEFSLVDVAGICCGKSILLKDLEAEPNLAEYMLTAIRFGYGIFSYQDQRMNWSAEYNFGSFSAVVRPLEVPTPSTLPLLIIGLLLIYGNCLRNNTRK